MAVEEAGPPEPVAGDPRGNGADIPGGPVDLCYVYVMGSATDVLKVGISHNPISRLQAVSARWPIITRIHMAWGMSTSDAALIERMAHRVLSPWHFEYELFKTSEDKAEHVIKMAMEFLGIDAVPFGSSGFSNSQKRVRRQSYVAMNIIMVRLAPDIKEGAEALAAAERRSISSWVGGLIADKVAAARAQGRRSHKVREPVTAD
jgi:hypothetical protein